MDTIYTNISYCLGGVFLSKTQGETRLTQNIDKSLQDKLLENHIVNISISFVVVILLLILFEGIPTDHIEMRTFTVFYQSSNSTY